MTNRLAQSQSLYLRKHAENPIDWWSWCDEAIQKARSENKPIFLSIGYSSCHWCTVMEGEAFSDVAIARYMNANFVSIKLDREERPDLDSIYMQALQLMGEGGGWPLNVFLSPDDLVPFYGGTYFPVEPRYGRPGFLQVLQAVHNYYHQETVKISTFKEELRLNLQQAALLSQESRPLLASIELFQQGIEINTSVLTARDSGPCFPMMPYADVALRGVRLGLESRYNCEELATKRGLDLALGGIFDHVAGGFHRYTVDQTWTVPHFEKMLYDNGQITEYLANLWSAGVKEPAIARAISLTFAWLEREMTAPEGYFYAAQDADSFLTPDDIEAEEGAFYAWEYQEVQELLSEAELSALEAEFTLTPPGNFEGNNVLQRLQGGKLSEIVESAIAKLFASRYGQSSLDLPIFTPARNNLEAKSGNWLGRIPPVTDTKMIVAWNSLMISGLARASTAFQNQNYLDAAIKAAQFILNHQQVDVRLYRLNYDGKVDVLAQSEDYALLIKALLDLHQATQQGFWLQQAIAVQSQFDEYLWSIELGGYYNATPEASTNAIVRERSYTDNATPAANGVAASNLVRLALLTEDLEHLERAEQTLRAFLTVMERSPQACPSLFAALDWYRHCTLVRTTEEQWKLLSSQYLPTTAIKLETNLPTGVMGLVCEGLSCQEPAVNQEQLWAQIAQAQNRSTNFSRFAHF
ncbi:thioredoxin domain-containing protein [Merismopedia glauca]|uniref:Thioredoxin domain-containing protein n=1 Tax=Merismopedia glauca CCAP 1448/3 TaxID=1296344 RepID=A0A2T1C063_9CYAN|nr:thioredoxin domain-containing protein [Merismopedia glauca]PSB01594.1 thioredoxin domain-containing protein [Merismopedia glauca CCAP 1448/3]